MTVKDAYLRKLVSAKEQIAAVQAEIDSLNDDIKAELYPFDKITLKDRGKVNKIVKRYNALSEYDRAKSSVGRMSSRQRQSLTISFAP